MLADSTIPYALWLPILLGSKKFADRFASFTGVQSTDPDDEEDTLADHHLPVAPTSRDYIYLLCIALVTTWFAGSAAGWVEQALSAWHGPPAAGVLSDPSAYLNATTVRILLISTIGIALSFTPVSRIPGSQELGMALLFVFVAHMGAKAEFDRIRDQAAPFILGCLIMITIHGLFCVIAARLFRTDLHTAAIASAANIGGVASATIVASYHRRSLVPAGILMALIGLAIGNFCGYITGVICYWLTS
jgi:uncharacterized membrane protein